MTDFSWLGQLLIYLAVLVFAISAHEAAHAWMSDRFGDDTARLLGRVTLNPVAHTDPVGTLLFPIMGFIFGMIGGAVGSIPLIGWGKPTPVNPSRWRNKKLANVMVSSAGIIANLIIAVVSFIIYKVLLMSGALSAGGALGAFGEPAEMLLRMMLFLNVSLAVFNLLPIPPLDGSKILSTFLPESVQPAFNAIEQYGFMILMVIIYFGVLRVIFAPVARFLDYLLLLGI